jgi:hypothetical protein
MAVVNPSDLIMATMFVCMIIVDAKRNCKAKLLKI